MGVANSSVELKLTSAVWELLLTVPWQKIWGEVSFFFFFLVAVISRKPEFSFQKKSSLCISVVSLYGVM